MWERFLVCRLFASAQSACYCSRDAEKGKVDIFKKTGSEIGKSAAAKSGGLFSAEDWQCSKWVCPQYAVYLIVAVTGAEMSTGHVVILATFAMSQNLAKLKLGLVSNSGVAVVTTVGRYLGLGGGYNERDEIIEYKDRDDSDGELDEVG